MFPPRITAGADLWTLLVPIIICISVSVQQPPPSTHDNNGSSISTMNQPAPKILVTGRTASSLALAWDDFRQATYDQGYLVEYRKLNQSDTEGGEEAAAGIDKWVRIQANNTPFMVLDGLRPNQPYQVRILLWGDRDKNRLSLVQSETITAETADGCFAGPEAPASSAPAGSSPPDQGHKQTYDIGETFFDGCAFKCTCRQGGISECEERCPVYIDAIGYEHCDWITSPDDECCKMPVCNQGPPPPPPSAPAAAAEHPASAADSSISRPSASNENGISSSTSTEATNHQPTHPHVTFPPSSASPQPPSSPTASHTEEAPAPTVPSTTTSSSTEAFEEDIKEHFVLPESRHQENHDQENPQHGFEPFCVVDNGQVKSVGEHWLEHQAGNDCLRKNCSCVLLNNGSTSVACEGGCASIPAEALRPKVECPRPELVMPDDPCLCPYVVCNAKSFELERISMAAISPSTVRVRFTLPQFIIGLMGYAELHYTTDLDLPKEQWGVQKFARPKRIFDTANIEYHLGRLRSDTVYYFQIGVIVDSLPQIRPESEIYTLKMPPMPRASTSTTLFATPTTISPTSTTTTSTAATTLSTTTIPPVIIIDAHLKVVPLDESTVKVTWRSLDDVHRKLIDGLQLKYRPIEDSDYDWTRTQMIHRDVNWFILTGLQPEANYIINLVYYNVEDKPVSILSRYPIAVEMPAKNVVFEHSCNSSTSSAEATTANKASVSSEDIRPYYIALTIVALFATVTGVGFATLLCVLLRNKSSAKAPITRAPSEACYDNPSYKTYDNEQHRRTAHTDSEPIKNGAMHHQA